MSTLHGLRRLAVCWAAWAGWLLWLGYPGTSEAAIGVRNEQMLVHFGSLDPSLGPVVVPHAVQLWVHADQPWSLTAQADDRLTNTNEAALHLPLERLSWSLHTRDQAPDWQPFAAGAPVQVLSEQPPTGPMGRSVALSYRFMPNWDDRPHAHPYRVDIAYTLSGGIDLSPSFAEPNPFDPGDGRWVRFGFELPGVGHAEVWLEVWNERGDLIVSRSEWVAAGGWRELAWDGTDETGQWVSPGPYTYRISGGEQVFGTGSLVVAAETPGGNLRVEGRVQAGPSEPVAGATVTLFTAARQALQSTRVDAQGRFTFSGLSAGFYYLEGFAPGYQPFTGSLFSLTTENSPVSKTVTLTPNNALFVTVEPKTLSLQMGEAGSLVVKVRNVGSRLLREAVLHLVLPEGLFPLERGSGWHWQNHGSAHASATLGPLPVGAERVLTLSVTSAAAKAGYGQAWAEAFAEQPDSPWLDPVQSPTAYWRLEPDPGWFGMPTLLTGTVFLDENGNGLRDLGERVWPQARVEVLTALGGGRGPVPLRTDSMGQYRIWIPAGELLVQAGPGETHLPGVRGAVRASAIAGAALVVDVPVRKVPAATDAAWEARSIGLWQQDGAGRSGRVALELSGQLGSWQLGGEADWRMTPAKACESPVDWQLTLTRGLQRLSVGRLEAGLLGTDGNEVHKTSTATASGLDPWRPHTQVVGPPKAGPERCPGADSSLRGVGWESGPEPMVTGEPDMAMPESRGWVSTRVFGGAISEQQVAEILEVDSGSGPYRLQAQPLWNSLVVYQHGKGLAALEQVASPGQPTFQLALPPLTPPDGQWPRLFVTYRTRARALPVFGGEVEFDRQSVERPLEERLVLGVRAANALAGPALWQGVAWSQTVGRLAMRVAYAQSFIWPIGLGPATTAIRGEGATWTLSGDLKALGSGLQWEVGAEHVFPGYYDPLTTREESSPVDSGRLVEAPAATDAMWIAVGSGAAGAASVRQVARLSGGEPQTLPGRWELRAERWRSTRAPGVALVGPPALFEIPESDRLTLSWKGPAGGGTAGGAGQAAEAGVALSLVREAQGALTPQLGATWEGQLSDVVVAANTDLIGLTHGLATVRVERQTGSWRPYLRLATPWSGVWGEGPAGQVGTLHWEAGLRQRADRLKLGLVREAGASRAVVSVRVGGSTELAASVPVGSHAAPEWQAGGEWAAPFEPMWHGRPLRAQGWWKLRWQPASPAGGAEGAAVAGLGAAWGGWGLSASWVETMDRVPTLAGDPPLITRQWQAGLTVPLGDRLRLELEATTWRQRGPFESAARQGGPGLSGGLAWAWRPGMWLGVGWGPNGLYFRFAGSETLSGGRQGGLAALD